MARKDNKGRNLKTGESQRADGRYMYRYYDELAGKRLTIYDSDLANLREREKRIQKDMDDQLVTDAATKKITVNTLFERYLETKNLREKTKNNYVRMWNYRVRDSIGNIKVVEFKTSHVRAFFSAMSKEGLSHSTIKAFYGMLNPCLEMAVSDGIIRKNPVTGTLDDYGAPAKKRKPLTRMQQDKLLKFVAESKVYARHLPMLQIMFGACLRVSETIGLTWSDIDMKNREINVKGQVIYAEGEEGYCFHDSVPKTAAGIRTIPMTQEVYDAFRSQRELNMKLGLHSDVEIGGRSGFIFNAKTGRPIMPAGANSFLKNIVNAYNKNEMITAEQERRTPELMPHISAHILRHTGCTRLGENNVNPKVMQYVMGHADANITMNIYNHIAERSQVESEMDKMDFSKKASSAV
ncbi:MAG: site-specific integrase [Coprococcus sp.]|nr:site-specific integrase [Coprococcus sp.]